jgi:serine/threonine-protein kinase HipA
VIAEDEPEERRFGVEPLDLRGRPSTHILKADDPYRPGLVEAEAHCLALAKAAGLTTVDAGLTQIGERAGGPGFKQAAQLLDSYAHDPLSQLDRLVAIVTFTVLTGNADAHGKNLALLHSDPEHVELAPLYDTVPTTLWPKLRSEAAMSVGAQVSLPDVALADIVRERARSVPAPRDSDRFDSIPAVVLHGKMTTRCT